MSIQSIVVSILLLSGDIESNPGPAVSTVPSTHHVSRLNVSCINAYSAINEAARLHSAIDECKLDILAVTETWIKESHPDAIKRDLAPPGFTVLHFHRPGDGANDRGGVAIVARDKLCIEQVSLSGKYSSVEILAVQCSTKAGR